MAVGAIASIATIVAAAASIAGTAYAATQDGPKLPNAASSSRKVALAQAGMLPTQRTLAAYEQLGEPFPGQSVTLSYADAKAEFKRLKKEFRQGKRDDPTLKAQMNLLQQAMRKADSAAPQVRNSNGKLVRKKGTGQVTVYQDQFGQYIPQNLAQADFTGFGTADIEGQLARQYADIEAELSRKYGKEFATQARQLAEQADPEGTAARKLEYEMIQKQIEQGKPISPLSTGIEQSVKGQLEAGAGFDPLSRELLESSIAQANKARAGTGPSGQQVADWLSTGWEGQGRRQAATDKATAWLSSGQTPEDIGYRREQQNLANLGAFVSGRTPESQFENIAGAGRGAAPLIPGQTGPGMPQNAASLGPGYDVNRYRAQVGAELGAANPWLSGISSILSATGSVARR